MVDPQSAITGAAHAITGATIGHALGLDAAAADFLKRVLAKPGDELSEVLSHFTTGRLLNFVKTAKRAQEMTASAGIEPREVPLRLMVPIIAGASSEDDPSMRERWAALLANSAADPRGISPMLVRMLADLYPRPPQSSWSACP